MVTAQAGRYHFYSVPDASSFAALGLAKSYIYLNRPVSVYGRSPASATTALLTPSTSGHARFIAESASDAKEEWLDTRVRSIFAIGLDGLIVSRKIFGFQSPPIDFEKWKQRIEKDITFLPQKDWDEQATLVNEWLARNQIAPIDLTAIEPARKSLIPSEARRTSNQRITLHSIVLEVTQNFIENVDLAVQLAEQIIGGRALIKRQLSLPAFLRWFGMVFRARRAGRNASRMPCPQTVKTVSKPSALAKI
jgi:hypothetical protein